MPPSFIPFQFLILSFCVQLWLRWNRLCSNNRVDGSFRQLFCSRVSLGRTLIFSRSQESTLHGSLAATAGWKWVIGNHFKRLRVLLKRQNALKWAPVILLYFQCCSCTCVICFCVKMCNKNHTKRQCRAHLDKKKSGNHPTNNTRPDGNYCGPQGFTLSTVKPCGFTWQLKKWKLISKNGF